MFSTQTLKNMTIGVLTKNRPFYVQYYILSRCNLVCRQCNIVEANSDLVDADLETVEKIAANLRKIGAGVVLLTGGEPFLRKDLPDIVRILRREGLNPRLQTAGFATTPDQLQACRDAGATDINISLDSLVPEKQNYINGSMPRSWEKAIETIVAANEIFDDPQRVCAFGTVLSKMNYQEVPAIVHLAKYLGWYSSIVPVHITSLDEPMNFRGTATEMRFSFPGDEETLRSLHADLISMKRSGLPIFDSESYLDSAFFFLRENRPNWRKNDKCDSPNMYFAILPNGDFAVCCDHRYPKKLSVADEDFPSKYRSRQFRDDVEPIVTACSGCNYGSYPEISLGARDSAALFERFRSVVFPQKATPPKRKLSDVMAYIEELRERYAIQDWDGPVFNPKPAAASQRYGPPEIKTRGARKTPRRFLDITPVSPSNSD